MPEKDLHNQSGSDAFDRNLEAMRINEVKQDLGFPVEEVAGTPPVPLTNEQYGHLHDWDVFIEDIIPKMEADHAKAHEIKPFEFRQFNPDHE